MEAKLSPKRTHPHAGFATRSCFNRHEVSSSQLRQVAIGGASVLVCSGECEAQARRRIERHARSPCSPLPILRDSPP